MKKQLLASFSLLSLAIFNAGPAIASEDYQIEKIDATQFEQKVLLSPRPALAYFSAKWCSFCKLQNVILDEMLQERGEEFSIVSIDYNENEDLSDQYQVVAIPTMIFFWNGQTQKRFTGFKFRGQLDKALDNIFSQIERENKKKKQ